MTQIGLFDANRKKILVLECEEDCIKHLIAAIIVIIIESINILFRDMSLLPLHNRQAQGGNQKILLES